MYRKILIFLVFFYLKTEDISFIPSISIITSIYKGEKFIKHFLEDITQQTIFNECELILINANSPENEEKIIKPFLEKYKNIIYKRLKKKVSLYRAWNIAIGVSKGKYITNANVDDRLSYYCFEIYKKYLEKNLDVCVVYSDGYTTNIENQSFENSICHNIIFKPEFSKNNLKKNCLPSFNPMWRKSLHIKYGLFNEIFNIAGDWEFWVRIASKNVLFKKLPGIYGVAYNNPLGLSTNANTVSFLEKEKNIIRSIHKNFFIN